MVQPLAGREAAGEPGWSWSAAARRAGSSPLQYRLLGGHKHPVARTRRRKPTFHSEGPQGGPQCGSVQVLQAGGLLWV